MIEIEKTTIEGALVIRPRTFADDRGCFYEGYNKKSWEEAGFPAVQFVQENQSVSKAGVLRGMHYQGAPDPQSKLVMCSRGRIFDVIVDIRKESPTFMQSFGIELKGGEGTQLFVPAGCLHGFYTFEESEVRYLVDYHWNKETEGAVRWNDPALGITWPFDTAVNNGEPILSVKDAEAPMLSEIHNPF